MRGLRRKIYDKGPIITVDLFMPKGEKVDIFSEYKFSLGYVVMKRTVGGMMKGEKRELERSEIIFTHDLLIFYVNFKCCSVEKD